MGHVRRLDHPRAFELDRPGADVVFEEPNAVTEQQPHDVELELVDQTGFEVLLDCLSASRPARA